MQFYILLVFSRGTSLSLILLSLVLVQIRSCINSYREALSILPEPSLCARPGCVRVCLRHEGLLLAASTGEKEACERQVERPKHRVTSCNWKPMQQVILTEEGRSTGRHRLSVQNHYWLLHSGLVLITGK